MVASQPTSLANGVEKPEEGWFADTSLPFQMPLLQQVASTIFVLSTFLRGAWSLAYGETPVCAMLCNPDGWPMTGGLASPNLFRWVMGHENMLGRSHDHGQEGGNVLV